MYTVVRFPTSDARLLERYRHLTIHNDTHQRLSDSSQLFRQAITMLRAHVRQEYLDPTVAEIEEFYQALLNLRTRLLAGRNEHIPHYPYILDHLATLLQLLSCPQKVLDMTAEEFRKLFQGFLVPVDEQRYKDETVRRVMDRFLRNTVMALECDDIEGLEDLIDLQARYESLGLHLERRGRVPALWSSFTVKDDAGWPELSSEGSGKQNTASSASFSSGRRTLSRDDIPPWTLKSGSGFDFGQSLQTVCETRLDHRVNKNPRGPR